MKIATSMSSPNTRRRSENDILIRLTVANRGPEKATLHLLPTLWFRNTWSWGRVPEECTSKPSITLERDGLVRAHHDAARRISDWPMKATRRRSSPKTKQIRRVFTVMRMASAFVKDAFHEYVVHGRTDAVNPANTGTKFAPHYILEIEPGNRRSLGCGSQRKMKPPSAMLTSADFRCKSLPKRIEGSG